MRTLVALLLALGAATPTLAAPGLKDGEVLGPDNWEAARGLLPDEILEHYKRGEFVNTILEIGRPGQRSIQNPPDFQEASRANRGRYALDARGSVVEVQSGKQPAYVTGLPFPEVDAQDPQAGAKVVWNYFYQLWYRGDFHFLTELVMLGRGGVERRLVTDVRTQMYDGSPDAKGRPNPNNLLSQTVAKVVEPADMAGTISLTWRFRDADRHDALWTYVPGLRKARQLSPLNRSDGFLGSDISLDDGPFFDGKPEDFTFTLVGRQDQLVIVDPWAVRGEAELVHQPDGGWRTVWKDVPRIGADDPAWKGLPWAPVSQTLVRRPVWIVEATPRDPNYLYGRILLRFDAETYRGTWASKYDRAGTLLLSYQASLGTYFNPNGTAWITSGGVAVQTAESFVVKRATVVLFPPRNPGNPADWRVTNPPDVFNPDALVRFGR
ncbi:MAG: DUF1329 domain-containing protein [Candidatus Binatia bacterium]